VLNSNEANDLHSAASRESKEKTIDLFVVKELEPEVILEFRSEIESATNSKLYQISLSKWKLNKKKESIFCWLIVKE
jgi:hypothetical protein